MSSEPSFPIDTRYYQFDQQGVVFNMWYLAFMEDARNAYLAHCGYGLRRLLATGLDIQVVGCQIDWTGPVRYGEDVSAAVRTVRIGRTSFALDYAFSAGSGRVANASSTYVVVTGRPQRAVPLPQGLRAALGREDAHETVNPPSTGNSSPLR